MTTLLPLLLALLLLLLPPAAGANLLSPAEAAAFADGRCTLTLVVDEFGRGGLPLRCDDDDLAPLGTFALSMEDLHAMSDLAERGILEQDSGRIIRVRRADGARGLM